MRGGAGGPNVNVSMGQGAQILDASSSGRPHLLLWRLTFLDPQHATSHHINLRHLTLLVPTLMRCIQHFSKIRAPVLRTLNVQALLTSVALRSDSINSRAHWLISLSYPSYCVG
jgi:hypothetical protein